jgi:predicted small integral membrane protein
MPARTRSAGLTEEIAMLVIRLAKIVCVAALALDLALVAFDNLTDYGTNFSFVAKVLSMSDIPPSSHLHWRAITLPLLHHASYAAIIITEIAASALMAFGVFSLGQKALAKAAEFHKAKQSAAAGLALGFVLYAGGFLAVGGEWFGMWESKALSDALQSAFRIAMTMLGALIFLSLKDEELDRSTL